MRVEDVPQEGNATLDGQRKGMYAVGKDGRKRFDETLVHLGCLAGAQPCHVGDEELCRQ